MRTSPTRLSPRWTCLPTCQHCTGVALGRGGTSTSPPRATLVQGHLGEIDLSWRWFTSCNFSQVHLGENEVQLGYCFVDGLDRSLWWITSCNSTQVHFSNFEVQLASTSLDFKITSVDLSPSRWSPTPNDIGLQLEYNLYIYISCTCYNPWFKHNSLLIFCFINTILTIALPLLWPGSRVVVVVVIVIRRRFWRLLARTMSLFLRPFPRIMLFQSCF